MNKVQLVGRTTKDIELRKTPNGKSTATFTLAVNRRSRDDGADYITCVAWGKTAELLSVYVKKGHRIGVCGRIQTRTYESNGRTVYVTEVIVEELEFLETKKQTVQETQKEPYIDEESEDEDLPEDYIDPDDLPF